MKPKEGILINSSCDNKRGIGRAINIATGEQIFEIELDPTTNNIIEFVSICYAIKLQKHEDIYTNNTTAMTWVKNKKVNSDMETGAIKWCLDFLLGLKIEIDSENIWINDGEVRLMKWMSQDWGKVKDNY